MEIFINVVYVFVAVATYLAVDGLVQYAKRVFKL